MEGPVIPSTALNAAIEVRSHLTCAARFYIVSLESGRSVKLECSSEWTRGSRIAGYTYRLTLNGSAEDLPDSVHSQCMHKMTPVIDSYSAHSKRATPGRESHPVMSSELGWKYVAGERMITALSVQTISWKLHGEKH
ncbi:hypothetical protein NM688_g5412 [Phlebia brevispora]|uniref:Uncharacterized protein n=1 Tax=Phlebia brevispora TaxID=194682 RepID=A0ACC1SVT5_9APHY|nr:hypothetical protein NM688_g5412 [Phlebia brevispora]